jgi:hypothetical protein
MFVISESFSHLKGDAPLWVRFLSSFSSWVSQQLSLIGSSLSGTVGQHLMCNTKASFGLLFKSDSWVPYWVRIWIPYSVIIASFGLPLVGG